VHARLCSRNPHKLAELAASLPGWELALLEADDYPPEDGATYLENARAKAQHGRPLAPAGEWVLGEDSGIEVAALGGAPGLRSARWAGDGVAALLEALDGEGDRRARYVCALVGIDPDGNELCATGTLEGTIALGRRGDGGFGYDPVFVPLGATRTVAELGNGWKAGSSHRARAAARLAELTRAP
jgi:XTP/dITP diphosphohydrolase